jgi:dUTP pyrophosphatase
MENMKIKISLSEAGSKILHAHGITPEAYGPAYDGESAGLDLYNCGEEVVIPGRNKWTVFGEPVVIIPTGIKMSVPAGCVALIKERSGILKTGLVSRAGVIDPGYTGEIFVNLLNVGDRDTVVQSGGRLPVQLIVVPCLTDFEVISNLEFLEDTSEHRRQAGSLGSSETGGVIDAYDASD